MFSPFQRILPEEGGVRPMIERIVVLLPTPLRPSRQTHSPSTNLDRHAEQRARVTIRCVNVPGRRATSSCPLLPKIDPPYLRVIAHLAGRSDGDQSSLMQDRDLLRDREDDLHVVFGEQQRQLALKRNLLQ